MPRVKKNVIDISPVKRRKHDPCCDRVPDLKAKLKESINKHLESMSQQGVVFPTNLPLEILLAPSKRTMKNLKGKTGEKKRAQNGFILYRKDNQFIIQKDYPLASQPEISKIVKKSVDFLVHNELFGTGGNDYNVDSTDHGFSTSDREFVEYQDDKPWKRAVTMPQMVLLPISESQECFESTADSQNISSSLQPAFYLQNIAIAMNSPTERNSTISEESDHATDFYRYESVPWNADSMVNLNTSDYFFQSQDNITNLAKPSESYDESNGINFDQRTEYSLDFFNCTARITDDFSYVYTNTSNNIYYPHLLTQTPVVLSNDSSVMVISPMSYDNSNMTSY